MTSGTDPQDGRKAAPAQSLIRKLTTDKAVKAYQQGGGHASSAEDITNIKLSGRGIKNIESIELPSLRRLDLSNNTLNRLKGLQGCPQVTYLTAAGNELTGEGLDGVRPLRDLTVFNASGNRLKRVPATVFAQFRALQALVLNNNEIAEVPPTWLKKGLLTLNTLVLSHNKVKSLTDTGLGRLTALTKLSVSHNLLHELPDLSACRALEELRASHNQISEVPASLAANVALRTLDLGHNEIAEWRGLKKLGKALTSLVQLTLSGNPICASGTGSSSTEGTAAAEEAGGDEGTYVTKIKSIFPALKVRDNKRVMKKKSHTYYEQRAAMAADGAEKGRGAHADIDARGTAAVGGQGRETRVEEEDLRRKSVKKNTKKDASRGKDEGTKMDVVSKKSKGGVGEVSSEREEGVVLTDRKTSVEQDQDHKTKKKRKSGDRAVSKKDSAGHLDDERTEPRSSKSEKNKKRRRDGDNGVGSALVAEGNEAAAAVAISSTDATTDNLAGGDQHSATKEPRRKESLKEKKAKKKPSASFAASSNNDSAETTTGSIVDNDPYSSSEELPIQGAQRQRAQNKGDNHPGKTAAAGEAGGAGGKRSGAPGGDLESGVVAVVMSRRVKKGKDARSNAKKEKGRKSSQNSSSGKWGRVGEGGSGGEDEETGGFSVQRMLKARESSVGFGLGGGVSAWD